MKIAIVGTGISGLTAAYMLQNKHDITVFEKDDRLGGHTATKTIELDGERFNVDTGFIVFNDWTYPNFIRLLDKLNVASLPTSMGFSVFKPSEDYEYSGSGLNGLFADRRKLLSLNHWKMIKDILKFNKKSVQDWQQEKITASTTLGEYLQQEGYCREFRDYYLIPMGSAIWSSSCDDMMLFPALFFIKFFHNHGLLSVSNRPTWRVISDGSKSYIAPLIAGFKNRIRCADPVISIQRGESNVTVKSASGEHIFDQVIIASHSDQALNMLQDPTPNETNVLQALRYRENTVTLHTDARWLPKRKRAWTSWNYCLSEDGSRLPVLTYNMNILQHLNSSKPICVTLNAKDQIRESAKLGEYHYAHPIFDLPAIKAQQQWETINGVNRTWFAGAYWQNGFHEDGVVSGMRVAMALGGEDL